MRVSASRCRGMGRNACPGTQTQSVAALSAAESWRCILRFHLWELYSTLRTALSVHVFKPSEVAHCLIFLCSTFQMLFFNLPLMAYLCWCLLLRCQGHSFRSHICHVRRCVAVLVHLAMALLLAWQIYSCYFLQRTYGTLAFFLSPMRTWLVALTAALIYKTWTLKSSELRTYIIEIKNSQSSWTATTSSVLKTVKVQPYHFVMLEFHKPQPLGGKTQSCTPALLQNCIK